MRIAVVDNLPEGGAKRVVYEQIKGLSRYHQVDFFTNLDSSVFPFEKYATVHKYHLNIKNHHGFFRFLGDVWGLLQLYREYRTIDKVIRKCGIKLALVHPCRITQAPIFLIITKTRTIYYAEEWFRLIYEPDEHGLEGLNIIKKAYERWWRLVRGALDKQAISRAAVVIANSAYTQAHLKQAYGVSARVIHPGVDGHFFSFNKNLLRKYFLFIGERDLMHGYPLIEAIRNMSQGRVIIREVSLKQGRFALSDENMKLLYQESIATLCLDRNEPFGLIPLESMACETPVIAIDEGGYRETIIDKATGYLTFSSGRAIYEKMLSLSKDEKLAREMGHKAREHVMRMFSWKRHLKELNSIIEEQNEN